MANCHKLFIEFNEAIMLTDSKKEILRKSRDLLRDDIRSYFKKEQPDEILPKFHGQGSYRMYTIVNPIADEDGNLEYDIDDGIYFIGEETDRKDVNTYHSWIYSAVKGRTKEKTDKTTCVRVIYADGHHIDLPMYFIINGNCPELAHKNDGWVKSDPREFYQWFNKKAKADEQLRRIVRYFKAWCDKRNNDNSAIEMPPGIIMTILTANNHSPNERDDISFKNTMQSIYDNLQLNFVCYRPTAPTNEDLFAGFSETQKKGILKNIYSFLTSANQAIENPNQKDACHKWQKHFGNRFSCSNAKDEIEDSNKYKSPAVISSSAKSGIVCQ